MLAMHACYELMKKRHHRQAAVKRFALPLPRARVLRAPRAQRRRGARRVYINNGVARAAAGGIVAAHAHILAGDIFRHYLRKGMMNGVPSNAAAARAQRHNEQRATGALAIAAAASTYHPSS